MYILIIVVARRKLATMAVARGCLPISLAKIGASTRSSRLNVQVWGRDVSLWRHTDYCNEYKLQYLHEKPTEVIGVCGNCLDVRTLGTCANDPVT